MDFGICATICNPSTKQAFSLPFPFPKNSVIASTTYSCINFFGFNPNDKQYKVLNLWGNYKKGTTEYMVFTSWMSLGTIDWVAALVSFDVQIESFQAINLPRGAPHNVNTSCLIQLEGHLVVVDYQLDHEHYCFKRYIIFPSYLKKTITRLNFVVSRTIDTGEIIMAPRCLSTPFIPFYVFYYNLSTDNFMRFKIFGLPNYNALDMSCNDVTVTNHVENMLPLCHQAS
ncbi:hypothetical protein P3X46_003423 [Hevea brasiliensis]|uniref:F-box associated beta-propeller type 3 domain-containing protein n=1 Tax=Hevea brasiliensis TaxID=3981 RepID=A0ABQ9N8L4_HEVBR|nr:hypothetical protein P3X46_003423 [Hevea brasiliensis]